MIKNIIKYTLFGLVLSFAFTALTIYFIKPREDVIINFPKNWQLIWLVIINCVGIFSHFIARWITPVTVKGLNKIGNNKKVIAVFTTLSTVSGLIGLIIGRVLMSMHKTADVAFLAIGDIIIFFVFMLFSYFVLYLIFEYKYIVEKQKNER